MEELNNNEKYKYNCNSCNFKCNENSRWEKHIETDKHKTGRRKLRSDYNGPYKCNECEYETTNSTSYKQHKLNEHSNKEERENGFKYYCKLCDYGTFAKILINKHNNSDKHKKHEKYYI